MQQWGDPAHASSVVKALAEAGRANSPGRSIKRMLQLRYTAYLIRIGGNGHDSNKPATATDTTDATDSSDTAKIGTYSGRIGQIPRSMNAGQNQRAELEFKVHLAALGLALNQDFFRLFGIDRKRLRKFQVLRIVSGALELLILATPDIQ